jgi:hypothetical protein
VGQDNYLPSTELLLQQFHDHSAMVPVQANDDIVEEYRQIPVRLSLRHCQENAEAQAVSVALGKSEPRRILCFAMKL